MDKYIISADVLNGILGYLMQRPYAQVANGVQALQLLEKLEEDERQNKESTEG